MDFSLPLEAHSVVPPQRAEHSAMSTALIVHPLSLYNSALSPTYGHDAVLCQMRLQMHEMQQLYDQQLAAQQQQDALAAAAAANATAKCLLDYTCDENVRSILGYLDGASLAVAQRVNRYLYKMSGDDMYWYHLCRAEWAISPEQLQTRPASYQALYKVACKSLKRLIRDFFEEQCLSSMQKSFRIPRDAALVIARRSVAY